MVDGLGGEFFLVYHCLRQATTVAIIGDFNTQDVQDGGHNVGERDWFFNLSTLGDESWAVENKWDTEGLFIDEDAVV